jgi:RHS repeat-associated protein
MKTNQCRNALVLRDVFLKPWGLLARSRSLADYLVVVAVLALSVVSPRLSAETITYYYTNQQGTPLATADTSGNILTSSDYRPYGVQALGLPEAGPGYTGHVNDPGSGLVYMQARYYDPVVGRFLSVDPDLVSAGNVLAMSRFSYGNNNPIGNVDPDGRQTVPRDAYTQGWQLSNSDKELAVLNGEGAFLIYLATGSDVTMVAPAGSGTGAVESTGFPGEMLLGAAITKGPGLLSSALRSGSELATESLGAPLPRMRVTDTTAAGAGQKNYNVSWTQSQFESHLSSNGYTMTQRGPVNLWTDKGGQKVFTTRSFSKSGGATGELFHSGQNSPVAKFRFDQTPGP